MSKPAFWDNNEYRNWLGLQCLGHNLPGLFKFCCRLFQTVYLLKRYCQVTNLLELFKGFELIETWRDVAMTADWCVAIALIAVCRIKEGPASVVAISTRNSPPLWRHIAKCTLLSPNALCMQYIICFLHLQLNCCTMVFNNGLTNINCWCYKTYW